ncbi:MAG: fibronectin type III domain-containing protein [candidate division WOR-3 bacterium]
MLPSLAVSSEINSTGFPANSLHQVPVASNVRCHDLPNDGGGSIVVEWQSTDDPAILGFRIIRQQQDSATWETLGFAGRLARRYVDNDARDGFPYRYAVITVTEDTTTSSAPSEFGSCSPQWFDAGTAPALIGTLLLCGIALYFISAARRDRNLFIRRISGLDAINEALGRATEMGRPTLYIPGLSGISDVATIASLNILGEVAKQIARFGTPLAVPNSDPVVYTVAREVVKEAYAAAGCPDKFNPDSVFFVANQQFAYAAAVDGIMVRERPATNFLIGMFWAESLILAETGAATGAVQIAGTDATAQLPFFITACDYTLIGEELYAASAYISREPLLLGAVKGQDWSKVLIAAVILVFTILGLVFNLPARNWL